jgi:hypothetical protein
LCCCFHVFVAIPVFVMLWWPSFIVRPLPSTDHSFECGVHPWIGVSAPAELRWNIWVYDRTECFFEYCPQFVYCCPFPGHLYDIGCQFSNFCVIPLVAVVTCESLLTPYDCFRAYATWVFDFPWTWVGLNSTNYEQE